ncbi:hypothetical protein VTO42DRAFT_6049 [Malbranchea cinnamomea]
MADAVNKADADVSAALDEEIENLKAQIRELTERRQVLAASLLSNQATQDLLRRAPPSVFESEIAPVLLNSDAHALSNHHRMAFSVTSFPYKDPSPHAESPDLLGIRIDICGRDGKFVKPYYLLLKRVGADRKSLRVHKHTIPVFIPLDQLEERYLPAPTDVEDSSDSLKPRKGGNQNLQRLVRELRRELVAWHIRKDAISWMREELGISEDVEGNSAELRGDGGSASGRRIVSLDATSIEARFVRVHWADGRTGRFKITNEGFIEDVIVLDKDGRDKETESLLLAGDRRVESLVQRLLDTQKDGD